MNTKETPRLPPSPLPKMLKALFWDCDFAALSLETDQDFIIARILTSGTWDAVSWLRSVVGDAVLREWLIAHFGGGLSPQRLRFWELILDLPHSQVNAWLAEERRHVWDKRVRQ